MCLRSPGKGFSRQIDALICLDMHDVRRQTDGTIYHTLVTLLETGMSRLVFDMTKLTRSHPDGDFTTSWNLPACRVKRCQVKLKKLDRRDSRGLLDPQLGTVEA